jgi:ribosomal-protein-alanine N-acetyltransferase
VIRIANDGDVDAVAELERVCLGADAWSRGLVEQGIANALPTVRYLVAELDDRVVGHAVASSAGDDAELQRIAVDPAYRRKGVASGLLAAVERHVAGDGTGDGASRLLLEVREDNATATAFYRSQGFEEVGRRRGYYRDGAAAVVRGTKLGHRGGTASAATPYGR